MIIPIDELIFFGGVAQPPTRLTSHLVDGFDPIEIAVAIINVPSGAIKVRGSNCSKNFPSVNGGVVLRENP